MIQFLREQLQHNPFFITAFVAGIVSAVVIYFKDFARELFDSAKRKLIFSACIYQNDPLFSDFEIWFYAHYSEKYKNVEASVNEIADGYNSMPNMYDTKKSSRVFFRQSDGIFIIRYKGKIIVIRKGKEKLEHASDVRSIYFSQYHLYGIKASAKIKDLLETSVEYSAKKAKQNELKIYAHTMYGDWSVSARISSKNISDVVIDKDKKADLIADMDVFLAAKEQYDRRHIFYKRGYCFHGLPGNGKTSLALAMASYMNRDIYCLDLNGLSENAHLKNLFVNLNSNSVLLIEDIDGFFNLREPIKKDTKISFSTLLNCMDGALYKEGLVTIITTNKREYLDAALIRTGRIDFMFEVPKPGISQVNEYFKIFYDMPHLKMVDYDCDLSMCDIQEICLKHKDDVTAAMNEFYGSKKLVA